MSEVVVKYPNVDIAKFAFSLQNRGLEALRNEIDEKARNAFACLGQAIREAEVANATPTDIPHPET